LAEELYLYGIAVYRYSKCKNTKEKSIIWSAVIRRTQERKQGFWTEKNLLLPYYELAVKGDRDVAPGRSAWVIKKE
jgi:hypothetical protein